MFMSDNCGETHLLLLFGFASIVGPIVPRPPKYCLLQSANLLITTSLNHTPSLSIAATNGAFEWHMEPLIEKTAPSPYLHLKVWHQFVFLYMSFGSVYLLCTTAKHVSFVVQFAPSSCDSCDLCHLIQSLCKIATFLQFGVPSRLLIVLYIYLCVHCILPGYKGMDCPHC